jgi:hypothetical protein
MIAQVSIINREVIRVHHRACLRGYAGPRQAKMRNASLSRPVGPPYGACCAAFSPVQGDPSMPLSPLRFGFAGQGRQIGSQFFGFMSDLQGHVSLRISCLWQMPLMNLPRVSKSSDRLNLC